MFDLPDILTYLFESKTSVVWHSDLTLLRFPLVPGETYQSLNLRLSGLSGDSTYIYAYEAEGVILGKIGDDLELVETPSGAFEDCLKIQYEAKQPTVKTEEFRNGRAISAPKKFLKVMESGVREELTDLLMY